MLSGIPLADLCPVPISLSAPELPPIPPTANQSLADCQTQTGHWSTEKQSQTERQLSGFVESEMQTDNQCLTLVESETQTEMDSVSFVQSQTQTEEEPGIDVQSELSALAFSCNAQPSLHVVSDHSGTIEGGEVVEEVESTDSGLATAPVALASASSEVRVG